MQHLKAAKSTLEYIKKHKINIKLHTNNLKILRLVKSNVKTEINERYNMSVTTFSTNHFFYGKIRVTFLSRFQ